MAKIINTPVNLNNKPFIQLLEFRNNVDFDK